MRDLDRDLEEAADEHSGGQAIGRLGQARREEERGQDESHVEEDRRRGRGGEAAVRVEDRLAEGRQRDEEDVRKDPPAESDRQLELSRGFAELTGEKGDEPRRREDATDREGREDEREGGDDPADERPRLLLAALLRDPRVDGDDRRGHGALADDLAEHVRDPECDEERIRAQPGSERRRDDLVAQVSGDPRDEGERSDRRGRPDEVAASSSRSLREVMRREAERAAPRKSQRRPAA